MVSVLISINGRIMQSVDARNVTLPGTPNNKQHKYLVYGSNKILRHVRDHGAVPLAIKMLKTIKETKYALSKEAVRPCNGTCCS